MLPIPSCILKTGQTEPACLAVIKYACSPLLIKLFL